MTTPARPTETAEIREALAAPPTNPEALREAFRAPTKRTSRKASGYEWNPRCEFRGGKPPRNCRAPDGCHCAEINASVVTKAHLRVALDAATAQAERTAGELAAAEAEKARRTTPRPIAEYHEDFGFVTWWIFPVCEPAWIGSPNCSDWPGYHTHFTPHPELPALTEEPPHAAE